MNPTTPERPPGHPARGIALFLVVGMGFAILDTVAKYLTHDYSVVQIAWARYVFAVLFMLPFVGRHGRNPLITSRPYLQIARGVLLTSVTTFFFVAYSHMPLADVTAIGFISPLIVTALGALFLGEKVGPRRWTAVVIGFIGVLIIVQPGAGAFHWAALLALTMAAGNAVFQIVTRFVSRYDSAYVSSFYTAFVGAVILSIAVPFFWKAPDLFSWVLLIGIGALGAFTHYCFAAALGHAPASTLAPYSYFPLLWVSTTGFLLFGDIPGVGTVIGGAIVIACGIYVFSRERALRRATAGS